MRSRYRKCGEWIFRRHKCSEKKLWHSEWLFLIRAPFIPIASHQHLPRTASLLIRFEPSLHSILSAKCQHLPFGWWKSNYLAVMITSKCLTFHGGVLSASERGYLIGGAQNGWLKWETNNPRARWLAENAELASVQMKSHLAARNIENGEIIARHVLDFRPLRGKVKMTVVNQFCFLHFQSCKYLRHNFVSLVGRNPFRCASNYKS